MTSDPNRHVKEYLDYYLDMKQPPHYAVMLKGQWGIGKSTLMRTYIEKRYVPPSDESDAITQGSGPEYVYVSLFGIDSAEQIQTAILHKAYPWLASKTARFLLKATSAAAKKFAVDPGISAHELLGDPTTKVFIFDDLERCEMAPKAVLGFINRFVEHLGRKVIVIAHDDAFQDPIYREQREKVIGQTLQMHPVLDVATKAFIDSIEEVKAREFLSSKTSEIISIFRQSGSENLRVLQQCIWTYVRFYKCTAERHRENDPAMVQILRFMLAWSLELKLTKLDVGDLQARKSGMELAIDRHFNKGDPTKFEERARRYPEVDLGSEAISTEVLIEMLDHGLFDLAKIQACMDQSSGFVKPDEEPAWRTVWFGIERDEVAFNNAVAKMEQQFTAREFVIPGLILQVIGLRLWLSRISVLAKTEDEVAQECEAYLDDLYAAGKVEPLPFAYSPSDPFDGYAGLGIHSDSAKFPMLRQKLQSLREATKKNTYPAIGAELIHLMSADPELFFRRLCSTNSSDNLYTRVPVLATIAPTDFVDTLLRQRPDAQKKIMTVFRSRYDAGELESSLGEEKAWLVSVEEKLKAALPGLSKIGQERISRFMEWFMPRLAVQKDG